jgi:hypothetical protein
LTAWFFDYQPIAFSYTESKINGTGPELDTVGEISRDTPFRFQPFP